MQQSWPSYNTSDPVIEQGFVCLVRAPHFDEIRVEVVDFEKKDEVLGYTTIRVSSLIDQPGMEWSLQPWILRGDRVRDRAMFIRMLKHFFLFREMRRL